MKATRQEAGDPQTIIHYVRQQWNFSSMASFLLPDTVAYNGLRLLLTLSVLCTVSSRLPTLQYYSWSCADGDDEKCTRHHHVIACAWLPADCSIKRSACVVPHLALTTTLYCSANERLVCLQLPVLSIVVMGFYFLILSCFYSFRRSRESVVVGIQEQCSAIYILRRRTITAVK